MHINSAGGDIPIGFILTLASLHDSQAAVPLALVSTERVNYCHEAMDAACDGFVAQML